MKKKKEQVEDNHTYTWLVEFDDGHSATGTTSNDYLKVLRDIQYTMGYGRYNYCNHIEFLQEPNVGEQSGRFQVATGVTHSWTLYDTLASSCLADYEEILDFDIAGFCQRAIEAVTPTMESGFSLPNFLAEIGELKGLAKWWSRGDGFRANFRNNSLQYSFGLIPTISDVRTCYEGLKTLLPRMAALKEGAGQRHVRHYSEELSVDQRKDRVVPGGITGYVADRYTGDAKYTATIEYTYQFPNADKTDTLFRGFLDSIGMQLDAYTVWEAIPYSFVVDWFFNVGEFLKQSRQRWIDIEIDVLHFGISRKIKGEVHGFAYRKADTAPEASNTAPNYVVDFKHYRRWTQDVVDTMFWPTFQGSLTLRKIFLGSLLIEQRGH